MRSKSLSVFCSAIVFAVLVTSTLAYAAGPNLVAAFFVKGKVGLKWQLMDGVDEYRIYRKPTSGEFEMIATSGEIDLTKTYVSPVNGHFSILYLSWSKLILFKISVPAITLVGINDSPSAAANIGEVIPK